MDKDSACAMCMREHYFSSSLFRYLILNVLFLLVGIGSWMFHMSLRWARVVQYCNARGLLLRSFTRAHPFQVHDAAAGRAADGVGHRLHDLLYAHGKPLFSYILRSDIILELLLRTLCWISFGYQINMSWELVSLSRLFFLTHQYRNPLLFDIIFDTKGRLFTHWSFCTLIMTFHVHVAGTHQPQICLHQGGSRDHR